jgi:hypothetical protein
VPESVRNEVQLEVAFRGNTATIFERRPPFLSSFIPASRNEEWTRLSVAQFRYDTATRRWALYCADRNSRWHVYDDLDPSERLEDLIAEVDADPTGIFWG